VKDKVGEHKKDEITPQEDNLDVSPQEPVSDAISPDYIPPRPTHKRRISRNKLIILDKLIIALVVLAGVSFFFLSNVDVMWDDLQSFNPGPIFLLASIVFIIVYVGFLVARIEDKALHHGDKFDITYKFVMIFVFIYISLRSFFMQPYLNVPIPLIVIFLACGIMTFLTPRIVDNDNDEF